MVGFHHHPDGIIYIRNADGTEYTSTVEEFTNDLGEAYVGLPDGCRERIFIDGVVNCLKTNEDKQIDGGNAFISKGRSFISKYPELKVAKKERDDAKLEPKP